MSKGNRGAGFKVVTGLTILIIATLIGALVFQLGWKNGKAIGEYEANSDTYARHSQDQIKDCFTIAEDAAKAICVREVIQTHNEHDRAEADLVAQTEMGLWALGMLVVTFLMAVVTGLGVLFVWRTLLATQDMATDTRDIGNRQTRAYCGIDNITAIPVEHPDFNEGKLIYAEVIIKNFGQTPGHRCSGRASLVTYSRSEGKLRKVRKMPIKGQAPLNPGAQFIFSVPLHVPNAARLPDEQIVITGYWKYFDCFGGRRISHFRYYFDVDANGLIPAKRGNYST